MIVQRKIIAFRLKKQVYTVAGRNIGKKYRYCGKCPLSERL